jgi:hypothetical protein
MHTHLKILFACIALLIAGCTASPPRICDTSVRVYQASNIDDAWINYVWVEVPLSASEGNLPGRLFVTSGKPTGAIVPSMIDLPCVFSSSIQEADLAPAPVEFEFQEAGNFQTTYSWKSCSKCSSECYMLWNFDLTLQGHPTDSSLAAKIVVTETFHAEPIEDFTLELHEVTQACTEPHMICRAEGGCSEVTFEPRR